MKKGRLHVIQSENKIIIKKVPTLADLFVFVTVFLAGSLFLIVFGRFVTKALLWVGYIVWTIVNVVLFSPAFLGMVVVDSDKKEISIYYLNRETYRFDEIKELKSVFQEAGDYESGMDSYKVLFVFENGRESELQTASKEQTEELIELLSSFVFS